MTIDPERLRVEKHALIRRDILRAVDAAKVAGGMGGRMLASVLGGPPTGPEDESELMGLAEDLVHAGLLTRRDLRYRSTERVTPDNTAYDITSQGTAVLAGVQRCPLVFDDRL